MTKAGKQMAIIGAGIAGMSTAIMLRNLGHEVALFAAGGKAAMPVGEHLAAEALHEFKILGIPVQVLNNNSIGCTEVLSGWGHEDIHANESIFNPFGNGYILSRPAFDQAMLDFCQNAGVTVCRESRVSKVEASGGSWSLVTAESAYICDFVIDASGRNSKFSFQSGQSREVMDSLIGVAGTVRLETVVKPQTSFVLIEPLSNGWWYSVGLATGDIVATFMTDAQTLSGSKKGKLKFWEEALAKSTHTQKRLECGLGPEEVVVRAAHSQQLMNAAGDHWLVVGDAAHSFDPLSSAGIIKGLKTGRRAAEAIHEFLNGNSEALDQYDHSLKEEFIEYKKSHANYYGQEMRWPGHPFWYKRNLRPDLIDHFSIHPKCTYQLSMDDLEEKSGFIQKALPELDIAGLIKALEGQVVVGEAVKQFLSGQGLAQLPPRLFHALESLKVLEVLKTERPSAQGPMDWELTRIPFPE